MIDTAKLISDFIKVAEFAGVLIDQESIKIEYLIKPHKQPKSLPYGKMAVYVFMRNENCLKVGRVGKKSGPRYSSQHYNPKSSKSNLAKSILINADYFDLNENDKNNIKDWIMRETDRINFIVDVSIGYPVLSLLESFLQCKLQPLFEGFDSQK